jgi:hypothetical protein
MYLKAIFTRSSRNLKLSLSAASAQACAFDQLVHNDLVALEILKYEKILRAINKHFLGQ